MHYFGCLLVDKEALSSILGLFLGYNSECVTLSKVSLCSLGLSLPIYPVWVGHLCPKQLRGKLLSEAISEGTAWGWGVFNAAAQILLELHFLR